MNVFSVFAKSSRAFLRKILCAYDVDVQCSIQVMWYEKIEKLKKEYICALHCAPWENVHHCSRYPYTNPFCKMTPIVQEWA